MWLLLLCAIAGTTDTPPTGAVIIDMGDCKEQRAFLYADVTSIASNHIAGSRQSESQPTSRRPSFSYQITQAQCSDTEDEQPVRFGTKASSADQG
eukprot:Em0006g293a